MPHPGHKPVKPLTPQEVYRQTYRQSYGKAFAKSFEETYRRLKAGSQPVAQPSPQPSPKPTGGAYAPGHWISAQTKARLAAMQQPSTASRVLKGLSKIVGRSRGASPIGIAMQGMSEQFRKDFESLKKKPPKSSTGSSTRTGAVEAKAKRLKPYTGSARYRRGGGKR